jgi:hypothetical protein
MALEALFREYGSHIPVEIHHGGHGTVLEDIAVGVFLGARDTQRREETHGDRPRR